ncbi:hypothetical protein DsansV1_C21g0167341 [Dioscorea sansibarensis]
MKRYPEILPRGLANDRALIILIDEQYPVIPSNRDYRQERRHIELHLELCLIAGWIGLVRRALDIIPLAVGPRLVKHMNRSILVQRVRRASVFAVAGLEEGREGCDLVPASHVALYVQVLHHRHRRRLRHARAFFYFYFYFFLIIPM